MTGLFDSVGYRQDLEVLQRVDPRNSWNWRLEMIAPLQQPCWVCDVATTDPELTFRMAVFRNPQRGHNWEISPIHPPYNHYPNRRAIVLEVLNDASVPVIGPSPEIDAELDDVRNIIAAWVQAALNDGVR
jgi:hypothetical protein